MRDEMNRIYAMLVSVSMLTCIIMITASSVSAANTTLTISQPKHGTSPVYVNDLTLFTLTSDSSEIWYTWDLKNFTKYEAPFRAQILMGFTVDGPPPMPIDLEGLQTLYYNATGESRKSAQVYVDLYPPFTDYQILGTNSTTEFTYVSVNTGIKLFSIDNGSGVAETFYRVNGGPYVQYISPFKLTDSGINTINYYSNDNLGNKEGEKTLTLYLDDQPPTVEIITGSPKSVSSGNLFLTSSTQISLLARGNSGISTVSYRVDSGTWVLYTTPFTISGESQHTITARATDNLGQQSSEVSEIVFIDDTPPEVFVVGHDSDSIRLKEEGRVEIDSMDAGVGGSTIYYSYNGGVTWLTYSSPLTIQTDTVIMYYASDALGNSAEERTFQVTMAEPGRPWTFYMGIALMLGGVSYLVYSFLPKKKVPDTEEQPEETEQPEKKADKREKKEKIKEEEEDIATKRKKKRNY